MSFVPSPAPARGTPVTSTKAIVSLVLGVLSLVTCVTGLPAAILGFLALGDISRQPQAVGGKGLAIGGIVTGLLFPVLVALALILPAMSAARQAAQRVHSINNMKQMGLAIHLIEQQERRLPSDITGKDGTPLLSWRVKILPYVEQQALYNQFHFDEPWDSPHNKALAAQMPSIFVSPKAKLEPGKTVYLRPKGKDAVLGAVVDGKPVDRMTFAKIVDGTSYTILMVEANEDQAVTWTKPSDLDLDVGNPWRGLGGLYSSKGFLAGFLDGDVRFISNKASAETLNKFFTYAGREPIDSNEY
jgi:hypothetical protein